MLLAVALICATSELLALFRLFVAAPRVCQRALLPPAAWLVAAFIICAMVACLVVPPWFNTVTSFPESGVDAWG